MRAQLTKNAVIVPAGAKGGFYLKHPPTDRDELKAEVERQYVTYIRSLLSVTDNLVDGEVVRPARVRARDGDDTYLVVAADKGTATFSDTANRVSQEFGFWLDDAFASGGSAGYDHKALGITAKGAWESVKRHFKELGVDTQADEFTVVGIGDMSGDVFGNGMLLSEQIRLVAAYDHRHIFIDPAPDAAAGYAERRRLFELAGSSWDDYDRELISEGGGVFPRTAKSIRLSPQAREALGISEESLPPTDVIRAILRAPVDLLWNGGIGTRGQGLDGDRRRRARPRVATPSASTRHELRAKVVGEGGNLGFTRRARVEYATAGGRINADFIDNSAGVDCSDHEVNLKILLGLAERAGELTREQRDELLFSVTEDVTAHVLYDSFLQAQIIAQEVDRSHSRLFAYEDLMALLEESKLLDRASEDLPTSEEIGERRRAGRGMERPELAVLVAYSKRLLARALERSDFVEEPWLERDLREYFPPAVVERFGHLLNEHPLRRQLICMVNSNAVVNALGPTFMSQLVAERGAEPADVVRAFRIAREVTGADARWEVVERLDGVDRATQLELMGGVDGAGRGDHALVPDLGAGGRHRRDDRRGPRRLRAARRRARLARLRRAPPAPRADRRAARRPGRSRAARERARPAPGAALRAGHGVGRGRDRPPDRGGRRGLLRRRRRAAPGLDGVRARARPGDHPDAALGAAGRARGRRAGPPRTRRQRARRDLGRLGHGGRRILPRRARRRAAPPHLVPARPVARGRAGPRRAHARRPSAARDRRLTRSRGPDHVTIVMSASSANRFTTSPPGLSASDSAERSTRRSASLTHCCEQDGFPPACRSADQRQPAVDTARESQNQFVPGHEPRAHVRNVQLGLNEDRPR